MATTFSSQLVNVLSKALSNTPCFLELEEDGSGRIDLIARNTTAAAQCERVVVSESGSLRLMFSSVYTKKVSYCAAEALKDLLSCIRTERGGSTKIGKILAAHMRAESHKSQKAVQALLEDLFPCTVIAKRMFSIRVSEALEKLAARPSTDTTFFAMGQRLNTGHNRALIKAFRETFFPEVIPDSQSTPIDQKILVETIIQSVAIGTHPDLLRPITSLLEKQISQKEQVTWVHASTIELHRNETCAIVVNGSSQWTSTETGRSNAIPYQLAITLTSQGLFRKIQLAPREPLSVPEKAIVLIPEIREYLQGQWLCPPAQGASYVFHSPSIPDLVKDVCDKNSLLSIHTSDDEVVMGQEDLPDRPSSWSNVRLVARLCSAPENILGDHRNFVALITEWLTQPQQPNAVRLTGVFIACSGELAYSVSSYLTEILDPTNFSYSQKSILVEEQKGSYLITQTLLITYSSKRGNRYQFDYQIKTTVSPFGLPLSIQILPAPDQSIPEKQTRKITDTWTQPSPRRPHRPTQRHIQPVNPLTTDPFQQPERSPNPCRLFPRYDNEVPKDITEQRHWLLTSPSPTATTLRSVAIATRHELASLLNTPLSHSIPGIWTLSPEQVLVTGHDPSDTIRITRSRQASLSLPMQDHFDRAYSPTLLNTTQTITSTVGPRGLITSVRTQISPTYSLIPDQYTEEVRRFAWTWQCPLARELAQLYATQPPQSTVNQLPAIMSSMAIVDRAFVVIEPSHEPMGNMAQPDQSALEIACRSLSIDPQTVAAIQADISQWTMSTDHPKAYFFKNLAIAGSHHLTSTIQETLEYIAKTLIGQEAAEHPWNHVFKPTEVEFADQCYTITRKCLSTRPTANPERSLQITWNVRMVFREAAAHTIETSMDEIQWPAISPTQASSAGSLFSTVWRAPEQPISHCVLLPLLSKNSYAEQQSYAECPIQTLFSLEDASTALDKVLARLDTTAHLTPLLSASIHKLCDISPNLQIFCPNISSAVEWQNQKYVIVHNIAFHSMRISSPNSFAFSKDLLYHILINYAQNGTCTSISMKWDPEYHPKIPEKLHPLLEEMRSSLNKWEELPGEMSAFVGV